MTALSQKEIERRMEESQRASDARREKRERHRWWKDAGLWAMWAFSIGLILVFVAIGINVANHV